ncbi:hypothetical protein DAPPUDRAFT_240916 [Daphnia pulex]|uniref:Uncharacterized protein n=1 Tax=Daphnia pulex TaxID=6669 RepID=E9GCX7_DAPPU|nr:hypothetical protein DAPPUDRAFT_240916 [Daphnia pulex]|eukprot:EFX82632.1 hypothetical protein DAPPUDRAFT_240916 [Daphnia pulex]
MCGARKIPTDILESMLDFVHDRRGTSTNVLLLIFKTYAHPASLLQRFLCCYTSFLALLHRRVGSLQLL